MTHSKPQHLVRRESWASLGAVGSCWLGPRGWLRGLSIGCELGQQTQTSVIWGAGTAGRLWVLPMAGESLCHAAARPQQREDLGLSPVTCSLDGLAGKRLHAHMLTDRPICHGLKCARIYIHTDSLSDMYPPLPNTNISVNSWTYFIPKPL